MIELRKQNDPVFPECIRRFGCRFFDLLAIPQLHVGTVLTTEQILEVYRRGVSTGLGGPGRLDNEGVMNADCRMGTDEHLVMTWAFRMLDQPRMRACQVGKIVNGLPVFWHGKPVPWQYIIGHWDTGTDDGHWTLRDRDDVEIYDSWEPAFSQTQHVVRKVHCDKRLIYQVWEAPA